MKKRPEKTDQTKRDFTEAFWQLYAVTPLERITVGQICEKAGYHRGTFYLHFRDVYQVLESVETGVLSDLTTCVESCMKRLAEDPGKLARIAALKDVVLCYERNKRYITVLLGPQGDPAFTAQLKDQLKPLWRQYVVDADAAAGRSEQEIDLILEYTLTGSLYMISRWLQDPGDISAYQLGHLVYDTALRNLPL